MSIIHIVYLEAKRTTPNIILDESISISRLLDYSNVNKIICKHDQMLHNLFSDMDLYYFSMPHKKDAKPTTTVLTVQ